MLIHELIHFVKDVTNPNANDFSWKLNKDVCKEWMDVDDNVESNEICISLKLITADWTRAK